MTSDRYVNSRIASPRLTSGGAHSTGCRCGDCEQGLRSYAPDQEAYDRVLDRVRVQVVTTLAGLSADLHNPRSYTCPCGDCQAERARRVNAAARRVA